MMLADIRVLVFSLSWVWWWGCHVLCSDIYKSILYSYYISLLLKIVIHDVISYTCTQTNPTRKQDPRVIFQLLLSKYGEFAAEFLGFIWQCR